MSDKLYIVAELGYEYDDNNYYRGEGSGSYPRTAYRTEAKAREVCDQFNMAEFKQLFDSRDIQNYGELGWLVDNDKESNNKLFTKYFGTDVNGWWDNSDVDWVIKPTEEDWEKLYDCFEASWYTVTSVTFEE